MRANHGVMEMRCSHGRWWKTGSVGTIVATHRVKAQMQHEVQGRREGIMQSSCLARAYRYSTHAHMHTVPHTLGSLRANARDER